MFGSFSLQVDCVGQQIETICANSVKAKSVWMMQTEAKLLGSQRRIL